MVNEELKRVSVLLSVSIVALLFLIIINNNLNQVSKITHRKTDQDNNTTNAFKNTENITVNNTNFRIVPSSKTQKTSQKSNSDKKHVKSKPAVRPPVKKVWKEQPILTPAFQGNLGNQMFEYASTYGLAASKNMSVFINQSHLLNSLFTLDMDRVTHQSCGGWHRVSAPCCDYDPGLEQRIDKYKCQIVGTFLQSWKFFRNVSASIRKQFTFKPVIAKSAHDKLLFLKQTHKYVKSTHLTNVTTDPSVTETYKQSAKNMTFIGIHARRGNYLKQIAQRQGRITPPVGYYIRAMEYFRTKYSNTLFVATSDSTQWLDENLKRTDVVILRGNAPEVDMCILSMCNHTIISVGSFGWWSGFLNGGTTVYYGEHFPPNTTMAESYKHFETDFIYPGWIGMK